MATAPTNRTPRKAANMPPKPSAAAFVATLTPDAAKPATLKPTTRPRANSVDYGPFIGWLNDSWARVQAGTKPDGMVLSVPPAEADGLASLVRRAAASIKDADGNPVMGVSVQVSEPNADGNVSFGFRAKKPAQRDETKPRRPVRKDAWTDAEYIKATNAWIQAITEWLTANGKADKVATITANAREAVKELRDKAKAEAAKPSAPTPIKRAG